MSEQMIMSYYFTASALRGIALCHSFVAYHPVRRVCNAFDYTSFLLFSCDRESSAFYDHALWLLWDNQRLSIFSLKIGYYAVIWRFIKNFFVGEGTLVESAWCLSSSRDDRIIVQTRSRIFYYIPIVFLNLIWCSDWACWEVNWGICDWILIPIREDVIPDLIAWNR